MSAFEIAMLLCFGAAWPFSICKSYTSRQNVGKSIIFLYVILAGYVSGVLHKALYSMDKVIYLYILNGLMVLTDIALYYRNRRLVSGPVAPNTGREVTG
jgi:hypothetical protein